MLYLDLSRNLEIKVGRALGVRDPLVNYFFPRIRELVKFSLTKYSALEHKEGDADSYQH